MSVEKISISTTGDIGDIPRTHAHLSPHATHFSGLSKTVVTNIGKEVSNRALLEVVIAFHGFQISEHRHRVFKSPVSEQ